MWELGKCYSRQKMHSLRFPLQIPPTFRWQEDLELRGELHVWDGLQPRVMWRLWAVLPLRVFWLRLKLFQFLQMVASARESWPFFLFFFFFLHFGYTFFKYADSKAVTWTPQRSERYRQIRHFQKNMCASNTTTVNKAIVAN